MSRVSGAEEGLEIVDLRGEKNEGGIYPYHLPMWVPLGNMYAVYNGRVSCCCQTELDSSYLEKRMINNQI